MAYKSKTLRKMLPKTRKIARMINELQSVTTKLKNILPVIESMELAERSFFKASTRPVKQTSEEIKFE